MDPVTTSLYRVIKTLSSLLETEREKFDNLKTLYDSLLAEKESVISHIPADVPEPLTSEKRGCIYKFINETMRLKDSKTPIIEKDIKSLWKDWKRSMGRPINIMESEVIEFLKSFDSRSTDKEIFGFVIDEAPK